ncbi:MAG TPA: ATP/GTP-binding protein [Mycobacteriales bacterium]|nr:ATP/GTP-binding protein [Mycobacteriales bacterium]
MVERPRGVDRVEDGWVVRNLTGGEASRAYRCPGCDQEMPAATPHVVAWPEGNPDDRRHWHTACWRARDRRGVKVHRSKNAPRFG